MSAAIETVDDLLAGLNEFTAKLRGMKAELVQVDQCRATLGGLNAEIGRKQEELHGLKNEVQQILAKLNLRREVA
jgi:hypothetical protein